MDHTHHIRLTNSELNAAVLLDATVLGPDDARIGAVTHVSGNGPTALVVVDVGGFLGMGAKPVALSASSLDFMRDEKGDVHALTPMTKDQVKALPEHKH
jgi:hypothetical protein